VGSFELVDEAGHSFLPIRGASAIGPMGAPGRPV
jgi:hypothetical protein